jgi:hypothetical protein
LFVRLDEERSLQKKGGYTSRIAGWRFVCCCPHKRNVKINSDEQHALFHADRRTHRHDEANSRF